MKGDINEPLNVISLVKPCSDLGPDPPECDSIQIIDVIRCPIKFRCGGSSTVTTTTTTTTSAPIYYYTTKYMYPQQQQSVYNQPNYNSIIIIYTRLNPIFVCNRLYRINLVPIQPQPYMQQQQQTSQPTYYGTPYSGMITNCTNYSTYNPYEQKCNCLESTYGDYCQFSTFIRY